ncbi:MAG TPA: MFS transporter [Streptosporangiaceae bacterium]|jgi:EmrB/QacA subfamily drug resistance transporter
MAATTETATANLRLGTARGRWVLAATVLGTSMAFLDSTVVNVALPDIGTDLGASLGGLQWTVSGYTLALAGLILLGGSLGDRLGRRKVFLIGVVWFALASALCGLSPQIGILIAARVLQGVGGALLTPGSLAIIQASFDPDDRPRAVGAWSGLGGVAGAAGPLLGGWLVQVAGWQWVFFLNLPLAAVVIAVTVRHVPETRDPTATGKFDIAGAALAALALGGITYALIQAPEPGSQVLVTGAAILGVAAAAGFLLVERHRTRHPDPTPAMMPLDVFASRQFSAVNLITFLVYAALGGVLFLLVVQVQVVSGYSPLKAGTTLLPVTLLMLAFSARSGALAQRIGPRWPMTAGTAICAVGLLLMTRIGPGASYLADVLPAVVIFAVGLTLTVAPLTATVLASADVRHAGVASGVNNAVARAAGLVAVAGLPAVVGLGAASYHQPALFNTGFHKSAVVCAGLLLVGSVLSAVLIRSDVLRAEPGQPSLHLECRTNCPVGAPPLEPPPQREQVPSAPG